MRWRLHPLAGLEWRPLGDEWVVFDNGSGLTHAMDPVRAAVLTCFEEQPHDVEALVAALRASFGLQQPDAGSVEQVIAELLAQHLIEPEAG